MSELLRSYQFIFFGYSNFSQSMVTPFPMMSAVHLQNAIPSYPSGSLATAIAYCTQSLSVLITFG